MPPYLDTRPLPTFVAGAEVELIYPVWGFPKGTRFLVAHPRRQWTRVEELRADGTRGRVDDVPLRYLRSRRPEDA